MPINHPLTQDHSFGPDELTVLATTFDAAILELGLGRTNPTALLVANAPTALSSVSVCGVEQHTFVCLVCHVTQCRVVFTRHGR